MSIFSIIIIALIGLFAVIGIITGAFKGFTRVKSWAVEFVLAGVITIAVSNLALSKMSGIVPAIISIALAIVLICLFMLLFAVSRKLLSKRIEKRKQLAYYKQYDEMEDNTEQILCALGTEDKKKYKKLAKRKFRQSGGVWSVIDRVVGAVTLAIKGAVIAGIISAFVLVTLDFTRLGAEGGSLYSVLGPIYESGIYAFFKNYVFDFLIVALLIICIKSGYSGGITSSLWSLVVLGLVVGSGVLAFSLSFNVPQFVTVAERLEVKLADLGIFEMLEGVGITPLWVAKAVIGLGIFILLLVAVILIAIFVPKLIDRARESVIFRGVDGVFGAIILTVLILAVLLVLGAVVNNLHDLEFMDVFNAYFEKSGLATYFYDKNVLNTLGILTDLPFKEWLS